MSTTKTYMVTAARWTATHYGKEAARRQKLRAERRPIVRDARKALASAKALDPQGVTTAVATAERALRTAQRRVPDPMWLFASKSAIGAAVGGYLALPLVPSQVWMWGAVSLAVAAVGAVVLAVARSKPALTPTKEERQLLKRLAPAHWREHCEGRGLEGTITGKPVLTEAGIVVAVRLDGKWTVKTLRDRAESVRALLGCRTGLRMEIRKGKRGGWAEMVLRTRSAADGDDLKWSPERRSFGVDTVTGELVTIPLGQRLLIAGMSGAGKSVASRPLLFDASEGPANRLVIIDLKRVEGRLWDHRARVATTPAEVLQVVAELVAEMHERLTDLPKGQATLRPTAGRPRITLVVDEGAEVMTAANKSLPGLETLARMGRAACIDLWWMTQKPTINDGIPKQIAPQLSTRICLAVSTPTEARVVLGEDAQAKGWDADQLAKPGVALVRDGNRKPNPIGVRFMDDATVIGLPAQPVWSRTVDVDQDDDGQAPTIVMPAPVSVVKEPAEARVLRIVKGGPVRQKDIADGTGLPKGTVSKVVARLVDAGRLVRLDGGLVAAAGTEALA